MVLDFFKKQFIDVIEWLEASPGVLAYQYPMDDQEIQNGAQLTVRESQMALFVNEGRIADQFGPGRYTLNTSTLPILTNLMNWDKLFQSPFKSDVFFFSTRQQLDQRWGTPAPVTIRDKEFGVIRIRANGTYSYQLTDPSRFYPQVSATSAVFTVDDMEGQLRAGVLTEMATMLGSAEMSFLDMAANQVAFSEQLKTRLAPVFDQYGLQLATFFVQSLTLPEELQEHLDKLSSMRMLGDLQKYAQFQAAESLPLAAQNEGGLAGAGAGLGAGLMMGQSFANALNLNTAVTSGAPVPGAGGGSEDPTETLGKLHDLLTKGVLTQAEFDAKKAELLKKIT